MEWGTKGHDGGYRPSLVTRLLRSPTFVFSVSLAIVYLIIGAIAHDYLNPIDSAPNWLVVLLVQCNPCILFQPVEGVQFPWTPWTLITSIFLHVGVLHLASNLFFLLIFGYILEEQVESWSMWATIFFVTGIAGNLTFLAAYAAFGSFVGDFGVGASGAVYGILGAAAGFRVAILLILVAGLDLFAGGGFFAHIGGLISGMIIRNYWLSKPFVDS